MNKKSLIVILSIIVIGLLAGALFQISKKPVQTLGQTTETKTTKDYILEAFSHKYSKDKSEFNIEVLTENGNYAKGSVNYNNEHSGALWFAVKQSGGWELAYDGNGIMPCSIANKYNLPNDMVPGCLDTDNGNNFVER